MNYTPVRDSEEFRYGAEAEQIVKNALLKSGFSVIPRCDYETPVLETPNGTVVLPDLDVSGYGHRLWVEVKRKSHAGFYRMWDEYTHYIEGRLWHAYHRIQEITTTPVLVVVCEDDTGDRLAQWIDDLLRGKSHPDEMTVGGVVTGKGLYFPKASFGQLQAIVDGLIANPQYQTEFEFAHPAA